MNRKWGDYPPAGLHKAWSPNTVWGLAGWRGCWKSCLEQNLHKVFLGETEFEQVTGGGPTVLTSC